MKNIIIFYLKIFIFVLVAKCSVCIFEKAGFRNGKQDKRSSSLPYRGFLKSNNHV